MADNVMMITDYLPNAVRDEQCFSQRMQSSCHIDDTRSLASGALRFVLAAGRPVIVTDETIFADCREAVLPVDPSDTVWMEERNSPSPDRFRATARSCGQSRGGITSLPVVADRE